MTGPTYAQEQAHKKRMALDVARGKAIKAERDEAKLKVGDKVPKPHVGDKVPKPRVKDDWHIRPRIITLNAVEGELPFSGCICCGALNNVNPETHALKHRASCLYREYVKADDLAFRLSERVEALERAMADIRDAVREGMRRR